MKKNFVLNDYSIGDKYRIEADDLNDAVLQTVKYLLDRSLNNVEGFSNNAEQFVEMLDEGFECSIIDVDNLEKLNYE